MATIEIPNCGQYGVLRDPFPRDLPLGAWSDGRNVRFGDGYVERMKGHQTVYGTPTVQPYFLLPYSTGSGRQWIYAGAAKMYQVSTTTHTNITRQTASVDVDYTATADNVWTGTVLNGIAILNNGTDVPQQYSGTGKAANLSNWSSTVRAKAIRSFKYSIVAMHLTESGTARPHRALISHPADPGSVPSSYDSTDTTKDVTVFDLSKTSDRLIDGLSMGDQFYFYKESSVYRMSYVGGQYIYSISDPLTTSAGVLALNCIAECPFGHVFLGQGDVFLNSGGKIDSILNDRNRRWLQTSLDATYYARSFVVSHPTRNEIWVCIPRVGASVPNIAMVWNWKDNTWSFRDLPGVHHAASGVIDATVTNSIDSRTNTIDSYTDPIDFNEYTQASQRLVMADDSTKLYLVDSTKLFDGANFSAYVAREGLDFGDPTYMKLVSAIYPQFDGGTGNVVRIYVGGANDLKSAVTWGTAQDFTIGTDFKADFLQEWRYIAIKFETTEQTSWRLKSLIVEYMKTGMF